MRKGCATPATQTLPKADGSVRTLSWQTCSGSKMSYLPSSTQRWSKISKIEKTSKSTEISANRSEPTEVAKSFSTRLFYTKRKKLKTTHNFELMLYHNFI